MVANGFVYRQVARNYGCGFVGLKVLFVMETNLVIFKLNPPFAIYVVVERIYVPNLF